MFRSVFRISSKRTILKGTNCGGELFGMPLVAPSNSPKECAAALLYFNHVRNLFCNTASTCNSQVVEPSANFANTHKSLSYKQFCETNINDLSLIKHDDSDRFSKLVRVLLRTHRKKGTGKGYIFLALFGFLWKSNNELKTVEESIVWSMKWAVFEQSRGNYEKAEKHYHDALHELSEVTVGNLSSKVDVEGFSADSKLQSTNSDTSGNVDTWNKEKIFAARAHIYDGLANLALDAGRFGDAEKLFKETVGILSVLGMPHDDNCFLEISLKMAMIMSMTGRLPEAKVGYDFCLSNLRGNLRKDEQSEDETINLKALLGMVLNSYARLYMAQHQWKKAEPMLLEALSLAEETLGEDHEQIAVLHSDLAFVHQELGSLSEAETHGLHALKIAVKTQMEELPVFYLNMAVLYNELKLIDKAIAMARSASKSATRFEDNDSLYNSLELIKELNNLNPS